MDDVSEPEVYVDSDGVDSDIEVRLYSCLHHEPDYESLSIIRRPDVLKCDVPPDDVLITPQTMESLDKKIDVSTPPKTLQRPVEVITIQSDSDSDECSKSRAVSIASHGVKRKRAVSTSSSESDHLDSLYETDSSDWDDADDILFNKKLLESTSIKICNVTGTNGPLARAVLSQETQDVFDVSSDSDDDDVDLIQVKTPEKKKRIPNAALATFLTKCQPSYEPKAATTPVKSSQFSDSTPKAKMIRKVTVEMLHSMPGSTNRFKRVKLDSGENPDLWRMDLEDLRALTSYGKKRERYYRRYHCSYCKDFTNHSTENCPNPPPEPTCFLCGTNGHEDYECKRKICSKCTGIGHNGHECNVEFWKFSCSQCNLYGHLDDNCPNHWRKFFNTTDPNIDDPDTTIVRNTERIFCSNCAKKGHFGFECKGSNQTTSWPTSLYLKPTRYMFNRINQKVEPDPPKDSPKTCKNSKRLLSAASSKASAKRKKTSVASVTSVKSKKKRVSFKQQDLIPLSKYPSAKDRNNEKKKKGRSEQVAKSRKEGKNKQRKKKMKQEAKRHVNHALNQPKSKRKSRVQ